MSQYVVFPLEAEKEGKKEEKKIKTKRNHASRHPLMLSPSKTQKERERERQKKGQNEFS